MIKKTRLAPRLTDKSGKNQRYTIFSPLSLLNKITKKFIFSFQKQSVRSSNPELPSIAKKPVAAIKDPKPSTTSLTVESVDSFEANKLKPEAGNNKKAQTTPAKSQTTLVTKTGSKPTPAKLEPIEALENNISSKKNNTPTPAMPSTKFGTSNSLKQQTSNQPNRLPPPIKT